MLSWSAAFLKEDLPYSSGGALQGSAHKKGSLIPRGLNAGSIAQDIAEVTT